MIKDLFPNSEISEEKPCTTQGKVQIQLRLDSRCSPLEKLLDVSILSKALKTKGFEVSCSESLGLIRLEKKGKKINIMGSGRIIAKESENLDDALPLLEEIAEVINASGCFLASK